MSNGFGNWFERARTSGLPAWKMLFRALLALFVVANFFLLPHTPEFNLDRYPGFWAVFGLVVAVLMVLVMKKIIQPMLFGPEQDHGSH